MTPLSRWFVAAVAIFFVTNSAFGNPDDLLDQAVEENAGRRMPTVDAAATNQLIRKADRLLDAREFVEAVRLYEKAYRLAPDNQSNFARLLVAKRAAGMMTRGDREALALIEEQQRATVATAFRNVRLAVIQARQALADSDVDLAESRVASAAAELAMLPSDIDAAPYHRQVTALRKAVARDRGAQRRNPSQTTRGIVDGDVLWLTDTDDAATVDDDDHEMKVTVTNADDGEIIDVDELLASQRRRLVYDRDLDRALAAARANMLLTVNEAALPPSPEGDMTFPDDWAERSAKRSKYRSGIIYRTPDFTGTDGRTYYSAIYDLGDLVHPVPNFYAPYPDNARQLRIENDDRYYLQTRSQIFNGYAGDLAAGLPLLHFFGGINNDAVSTRTDPRETQRVVQTIERFLGGQ